jgi:hypothetical protein
VAADGDDRRPLSVLGAERPLIAEITAELRTALRPGGGASESVEPVRLRSERLGRGLEATRTLVEEGVRDGDVLRLVTSDDETAWMRAPVGVEPGALPPSAPGPATAPFGAVGVDARGPRRAPLVVAVVGALLLGAGGATAALLLARDDPPAPAAAGPVAEPPTRAAASAPGEPDESANEVAPSEVAPAEPPGGEPLAPTFTAGRWLTLASFRDASGAESEAERLRGAGIGVAVLPSDEVVELLPGFLVVAAGPLATEAEERRVRRVARGAGIPARSAQTLTPVGLSAERAALAGRYSGELKQVSARSPKLNKTIPTEVVLDAAGTGRIVYEGPACTGTLSLVDASGAVAVWDERIDSGRCTDGGRWRLRRAGDELTMTWQVDGARHFVAGRLLRTDF